jgi:hypothetical protein
VFATWLLLAIGLRSGEKWQIKIAKQRHTVPQVEAAAAAAAAATTTEKIR